jgi:ribosome biogenesis GTPase
VTGIITKALSGVYFVRSDGKTYECKARGRFRYENASPLVGDAVVIELKSENSGTVTQILPRKNSFVRPPVANIDVMVIVASAVNPVTDPFLIDRMAVIAGTSGAESVICLNKCDLDVADALFDIYTRAGFPVFRVSAETGEGTAELLAALRGKTAAFTGNSGVGKSSILNALGLELKTGEVSEKLGRGRHTTRHTEIHDVDGAFIIDTPGFSSFDTGMMERLPREDLERAFIDFVPYLGKCRFRDCAHIREPGCAILEAVEGGEIVRSRHESYIRLTDLENELKAREYK